MVLNPAASPSFPCSIAPWLSVRKSAQGVAIFELLFGGRLYAITGSMKNPVKLGVNRLNIVGFQFPFVAFLSRVSIRWNLN